jgi:hypothetical protein
MANSKKPPTLALFAFWLLVTGCVGRVDRIYVYSTNSEFDGIDPVVRIGQATTVVVYGTGKCDQIGLSMGDGRQVVQSGPIDFSQSGGRWVVPLTYPTNSWLGKKRVSAFPVLNCGGGGSFDIQVWQQSLRPTKAAESQVFIGLAATPIACNAVNGPPPFRAGSVVTIRNGGTTKVDFGCAFGGCIYGIDGVPGSRASPAFPFPGMREYSLVVRIGNEVFQGGDGAVFTVGGGGVLELCMNDNTLSNNSGAWGVGIQVDETGTAP